MVFTPIHCSVPCQVFHAGCGEVQLNVCEGMRLSDLNYQDSYSYEIASVFVGGDSEQELLQKYCDVQQALPLTLVALS